MAEFVKKTMMGYKEVPGGASDPECTHVILTKKELDRMLREKAQVERESQDTRYAADRAVQEAKSEARRQMQQVNAEARQQVSEMEQELAEARKNAEYQRELNTNLLRIAKERANADRKLRPKKGHTGYFVVFSNEKEYGFKINRNQWGRVRLWETMVQSPYSVEFTEEQAREQIAKDLFGTDEDDLWLIGCLGIDSYFNGKYEDLIVQVDWNKADNIALRPELKLRANFRDGYWEASFLHTKAIGIVPLEMRV